MRVEILYVILSGLAGTATMALFMKLLSYFTHRNLEVVQILGTMLTHRYVEAGDLSEYAREVKAPCV